LRLFVDGERWKGGDYRGHRTVLEMVEWLLWVEEQHKSNMDDDEKTLQIAHEAARKRLLEGDESDEAKHWADQMARQKKPEAQYMERFGTSWMPTYRSFDGR